MQLNCCYFDDRIIPSLQLGTGKMAAVRVSGRLVGKTCRCKLGYARTCPRVFN